MRVDLHLSARIDGMLFLAEAARNPPSLPSHCHDELELNVVASGEIIYVVDGRRIAFGKRSLLWFFPNQEHQLVTRTPDAAYYVAVFKPEMIREAFHSREYQPIKRRKAPGGMMISTGLEAESFDVIRKTMDAILVGSIDPDALNREAGYGLSPGFRFRHSDPDGLNAGLRHLLAMCWRSRDSGRVLTPPVPLHPSVRRALGALADGGGELALPELARACGVSPSYLSRTFQRQVGVPLSEYRNSLRLTHFMERVGSGASLLEAAHEAGFGSYAQFYKVFRRAYGVGPRACLQAG